MIKKLFTLFAALTLCVGLWAEGSVFTYTAEEKLPETTDANTAGLHINAFYAADSTQLTVTHTFNEGVGTITLDGEVAIIGERAFYNCAITSITLPASVTTIGKHAFFGCSSLQSITLPDGLTTFGDGALYNCQSLKSVTIPAGVTTIGLSAFSSCTSLESITIPASVTTIVNFAFRDCSGLTSVTFLGNACQEGIGDNAFYDVGNPDPALLTLPNSWTGTLPDEDGKWYGGVFNLREVPTALPNANANANANANVNKFFRNGQLIIDANGKRYNAVGF